MAGGLLAAYLAVGEDDAKRERACERLKGHADAALADFNIDELRDAASLEPAALVGSCQQLPFGEDSRVVIVQNAERLPAETVQAFIDYLEHPSPTTVVLLTAAKLAKNTRLYKAVAKQGKSAVISCEPVKGYKLAPVVTTMAQERGLRLGPGAADELVARLGESQRLIGTVLDTLAETHGPGAFIGIDVVVSEVAQVQDVKPWDVCDAICDRNAPRALELLGRLGKTSPLAVHSWMVTRIRELLCFQSLGGAAAGELGGPSWRYKRHDGWARRFSTQELTAALEDAALVERALKGAASGALADGDAALKLWALSLCTPGAPRVRDLA